MAQQRGREFTPWDVVQQAKLLLDHKHVGILIVKDGVAHLFRPRGLYKFAWNRVSSSGAIRDIAMRRHTPSCAMP
jgi:hypothetical protein